MTTVIVFNNEVAVDSLITDSIIPVYDVGYSPKSYGDKFIKRKGFLAVFTGTLLPDSVKTPFIALAKSVCGLIKDTGNVRQGVELIDGVLKEYSKDPDIGIFGCVMIQELEVYIFYKGVFIKLEFNDNEEKDIYYNNKRPSIQLIVDGIKYTNGTGGSYVLGALCSGATVEEAMNIAINRDLLSGGKLHFFNKQDYL